MVKYPKISVNIPLRTSENAEIVIQSLQKVKYPKNKIEVIIIEGTHIAKQRNKGIQCSDGEIIYLLDNDSEVQPNALQIIAKEFSNKKIAVLGGPSLSPIHTRSYFSRLIGYVLETQFGALRMRFRYSQQTTKAPINEYHLIGANLALRKKLVVQVGGFNEKIVPNEETELLRRIQKKGHILRYNERLFVRREQRTNIIALIHQFYRYGKGRAKQINYAATLSDVIFILPILFLFYLISLILYHAPLYFIPIVLYMIAGITTSLKASIKYRDSKIPLIMPFLFPIIHLSYTIGLLQYLLKPNSKTKKKLEDNTIRVRSINLRYYRLQRDR